METSANPIRQDALASAYVRAKTKVLAAGYVDEIIWQRNIQFRKLTECDLLRECAWVILSSGMREAVIEKKFPAITSAFLNWSSSAEIVNQQEQCIATALLLFQHRPKIRAIVQCARITHEMGFESLHEKLAANPIEVLSQFPYLGPATSYHVAKNIGFCVAKPDRHLCRLADASGYRSPAELCQAVADYVGDPVAVVDIVLWRYATLQRDYMTSFLRTDSVV